MSELVDELNCSHLALMVDERFVVQHISYSQESRLEFKRNDLIGKTCYSILWNLKHPCSKCPLINDTSIHPPSISSHFQYGITPILENMISESIIPLSEIKPHTYIILLEPVLSTGSLDDGSESFILPSIENLNEDSKGRAYLAHLHYHRMFYQQFYEYGLTHTEQEVALFILQGLSSKEIASRLFISKKSVDFHRHNIRKKFGLIGKRLSISNFLQSLVEV